MKEFRSKFQSTNQYELRCLKVRPEIKRVTWGLLEGELDRGRGLTVVNPQGCLFVFLSQEAKKGVEGGHIKDRCFS